jgi:hypothetical protein
MGSMNEVHKAKSLRLERERLGLLNIDMHIQIRILILTIYKAMKIEMIET